MPSRVTTAKRSRKTGAATQKTRRTTPRTRTRKPKAAEPERVPADAARAVEPDPPVLEAVVEPAAETVIVTGVPEPGFAARVPPAEPPPARPAHRRGVFFDVENTSRAGDISRVLEHLALDWVGWSTEFTAVGNWRVIGHDTARLLAQHGAALVHSAPSVGVRDWSDLRIAVSAGVWLAGARPGDVIEIVSDDQAFDAVGDVAASLGVTFHRTSYRALAGRQAVASVAAPAGESRARRSRRSGRRGRSERGERRTPDVARMPSAPAVVPPAAAEEPHTAPHDELVGVVRDLLATSPGGVSLDALANALRERGFSRPPGSPRLITRLRRIKQLDVSRSGTIRLVEDGAPEPRAGLASPAEDWPRSEADAVRPVTGVVAEAPAAEGLDEAQPAGEEAGPAASEPGTPSGAAPRRRRRRGGRRRRGRRNGAAAAVAATPETA
jgi:hypothetical protein